MATFPERRVSRSPGDSVIKTKSRSREKQAAKTFLGRLKLLPPGVRPYEPYISETLLHEFVDSPAKDLQAFRNGFQDTSVSFFNGLAGKPNVEVEVQRSSDPLPSLVSHSLPKRRTFPRSLFRFLR
jgi:hypothetical protein